MQIILMAVTLEAGAVEEAGIIVTTCGMQVPMSALLLLRVISKNRIRISLKALEVNAMGVMAVVLAKELMEANKAADS